MVGGGGSALRAACRTNEFTSPTPGEAPGFVQANLVVVPVAYAFDFLMFCLSNPKACPLLDVTDPHSSSPREASRVAPGSDLATDVPRYRVWVDGEVAEEVDSVADVWEDENGVPMVGFLLGCSFSWEDTLAQQGFPPAHIAAGSNVAMYDTHIPNVPVGPFAGNLVVSMRPYKREHWEAVGGITGCYPGAHGAPVAYGDPDELGIKDVACPDYGDAVEIPEGTEPVFWACGVTPQSALKAAKIPLAITHAPGYMFVTDVRDEDLKAPCETINIPM